MSESEEHTEVKTKKKFDAPDGEVKVEETTEVTEKTEE